MKPKIRLLIFDLDGTLVDSAPDIITAVNGLLIRRQMPPLSGDIVRAAIGEGLKQLIRKLFADRVEDSAFVGQLEREMMDFYDRHLLDKTRPYPGVEEFLENCPEKIAILSNKHEVFVHKTIAGLGLDRFPWLRMLGGDSLHVKKPDPLPFQTLMREARVAPEETVMIGDGIPDMAGAQNSGIRSIACTFGYADIEALCLYRPTATLARFSDLRKVLDQISSHSR